MISEQDRKLAEDTFSYIERSEASGSSYEANLPAVTLERPADWPERCLFERVEHARPGTSVHHETEAGGGVRF